jgi:phosphatidyl-myo-inositol alpha-mannosyltransferase
VLRGGTGGELFQKGDPADLAAAIGRMLDDPARRARLATAASVAVREYDWAVVARDVLRVYEAVAPAAGRVPVDVL